MDRTSSVAVVGTGLAGSLLALVLARRGLRVDVYERRPDPRSGSLVAGRSINLALSARGIHALQMVGLDEEILRGAVPMRGRFIHPLRGETSFVPYGRNDKEVINSISRAGLNLALIERAGADERIRLRFDQRCLGIDFARSELMLHDERERRDYRVGAPVVIATDGVASPIRISMLAAERFDFSQSYLEHGYKELCIPAGQGGKFQMEKHALHIWPRGGYMMIALPNLDGSFTCTLFFPHEGDPSFARLGAESELRSFFAEQFPDALELMPTLAQEFFSNPTGSLVTIKCGPWHVGGQALLLGDSAHAVVPFYGQGMNCAFEDCAVLDECIGLYGDDWKRIFSEYYVLRKRNTDAIADLAIDNFIEMRDTSGDPKFALKKRLEHMLEDRFPGEFVSKYSMVTFQRVPYSDALRKGRVQDEVLMEICGGVRSLEELNLEEVMERVRVALKGDGPAL